MGAWGEGPSQNDDAADIISEIEYDLIISEIEYDLKDIKDIKDYPKKFVEHVFQDIVIGPEYQYVLGAAEWLLVNGYDISGYRKAIDQCIDEALESIDEEGWTEPNKRIEAMNLFRDMLDGKEVDPELVEEYSEGLLNKAYRFLDGEIT